MTRADRRLQGRDEKGFFTLWILGLCVIVFMVGGISLDLWRGFSDRRELASMTDAAAVAAASQIDLAAFQAVPSQLRLDPVAAQQRATEYLNTEAAASNIQLTDIQVVVDGAGVQVTATKKLNVTLSRILAPGDDLDVRTTSSAEPRLNG